MKKISVFFMVFLVFSIETFISVAQPVTGKVLAAPAGGGDVQVYAVARTVDRNFLVAGSMNQGALVMKLDSSGTVLWSKAIGSLFSSFYALTATSDSCFVLAGAIQNPVSIEGNFLCVKLNSAGDTLWTKTLSMDAGDACFSIKQTFDNGLILAGTSSYAKVLIAKLDHDGNFIWGKKYIGGSLENHATEVEQTSDGGFVVTGYMENYPVYEGGMFLMKLTAQGDVSWARHCVPAGGDFSFGQSVEIVPGGYVAYFSTISSGVALARADTSGNILWCQHYMVPTEATAGKIMRLIPLSGGGFLAVYGNAFNHGGLLKMAEDGTLAWHRELTLIAEDLVEFGSGRLMLIGNGPIGGVKSSRYVPRTGALVLTDSLGNGTCSEGQGISSGIFSINFPNVAFTSDAAGVVSHISLPFASVTLAPYPGCVEVMSTVDVKKEEPAGFTIYPNPNSGIFNVSMNGSGSHDLPWIEVYNVLGERIYKSLEPVAFSSQVNLAGCPPGIYQLRAVLNGHSVVQKLFISR